MPTIFNQIVMGGFDAPDPPATRNRISAGGDNRIASDGNNRVTTG